MKTLEEKVLAHRKSQRKYKLTEKGKAAQKRYYFSQAKKDENLKWYYKNKFKDKTHKQVAYAIKIGKLKRQACEVCGKPNGFGHHDDYSKPLIVRWVCNYHHSQIHRGLGVSFYE